MVLALTSEPMSSPAKTIHLPANVAKGDPGTRTAIAAWITEAGQIEPFQAVGGWTQ